MEAGMAKRIANSVACASVLILCATNAAVAIECKALPDLTVRGKWSLEWIDGKVCWFLGDSGTPKEDLHWPGRERAEAKKPAGAPAPEQAQAKKSTSARAPEPAQAKKPANSQPANSKPANSKPASTPAPEQAKKLAAAPAGQKTQCLAEPDKSKAGHWWWRQIDGRQCWYIGEARMPKERLEWPAQERVALPNEAEQPKDVAIPTAVELPKEAELPKVFGITRPVEPPKQAEPPANAEITPELHAQSLQATPPTLESWQLVNQTSDGDLEFLAQDGWVALMSIDLNLGAEYLTQVPTSSWPVLAQRSGQ
jgi:hypothetical protein